jgi:hypothetical protein
VVVAAGRLDLDHAVADVEQRDVEGAAAQVEDQDLGGPLLLQVVSERRRGRLVDDPQDVEARDRAGLLGRLPLRVAEVFSPRYASASRLSFCRMNALICCGVNFLPSMVTDQLVPMCRLTERIVRSTLVTACRFATSPTSTSAFLANATTDGVVREPSAFAMTVGSPPSRTATTELVVPRSIPTARAMSSPCSVCEVESSGLKPARGEPRCQMT